MYELTDNVLRGPELYLDLKSDLLPGTVKRTSASPTVVLNGVSRASSSGTLKTVRAKSYSVIIDDETDQVLAVTGNGVVLTPLQKAQFPGIFVNKMALSKPRSDLASDLRILGKDDRVTEEVRSFVGTTTRQAAGSCASGTTHFLEIAVAYDNTFCALYDDKERVATEALQEVVDKANEAYAINTCVQLALVYVEAHCDDSNDPYKGFSNLSPQGILNSFQRIWVDSRDNIERDAAYIITGFPDGTSVAGIAYISAACSNRNGYGWIEGPSSIIFAHEVGHTLGGQHTSSGIMGAVATSGTKPSFSAQSVQQFNNYIDNFGGSACMETKRPSGVPAGPPRSTAPPTQTPTTTQATSEPEPVPPPGPVQPPVVPTREPPSTTNPLPIDPPVGGGETCDSGFTKSNSLSCSTRRLRSITFRGGSGDLGNFRTSLQQRNGQFIMRYRVTGELFISEHRELLTTDPARLRTESKGEFKTTTGNMKKVNSPWNADDILIPAGETTCCGNTLYIGMDVSLCIKSGDTQMCQTFSETYMTGIVCSNACRGNPSGKFTPMSANEECPSCT